MKIAIDFDGTLWDHAGIQGPNIFLIEAAKRMQAAGHQLILWTCRFPGHRLEEAVACCAGVGLRFDAVNENLPGAIGDPRKVVADLYIDDRSTHPTAVDSLLTVCVTKG